MKNKLRIITIIALLSASHCIIPGYESPMKEDELERLGYVNNAGRTEIEEESARLGLVNDAGVTGLEEELEHRGYINDAGRTTAEERRAHINSYY